MQNYGVDHRQNMSYDRFSVFVLLPVSHSFMTKIIFPPGLRG